MSHNKIPILVYHSIENVSKSTKMRSMHVAPKRFKFQMMLLKMMGYKGLSMRELKPYIDGHKTGKVVGITFDDGYKNNLVNAVPILLKYGFSATCYLVQGRIGEYNVWDIKKNLPKISLMSSNEIFEWIGAGMDIGAHSLTHPNLTKIDKQTASIEIEKCKINLENEFNIKLEDFCYPYGCFDEDIVNITSKAGFSSAVTMNRGRASIYSNRFALPRIPITHHTLPHLFVAKIISSYEDKKHHS